MKSYFATFQIGKQGLTEGVLNSLESALKNHKQVRVTVLKSFCRDREELKDIVKTLEKKLSTNFDSRIIGFTIILIKKFKK